MEGLTVDTCSWDGSRQTSFLQLLSSVASTELGTLESSATVVTGAATISTSSATIMPPANNAARMSSANSASSTAISSSTSLSNLDDILNNDKSNVSIAHKTVHFAVTPVSSDESTSGTIDFQIQAIVPKKIGSVSSTVSHFPTTTISCHSSTVSSHSSTISQQQKQQQYSSSDMIGLKVPRIYANEALVLATSVVKSDEENAGGKKLLKRGGGKKRYKKSTDFDMPKSPATAYTLFCNERRSMVKIENPDATIAELMKILGKLWVTLAKNEKQKYIDAAGQDLERYKQELCKLADDADHVTSKKFKSSNGSNDSSGAIVLLAGTSCDLYCQQCDLYFHNFHNKNEHLKSKFHRKTIKREFDEIFSQSNNNKSQVIGKHLKVDADDNDFDIVCKFHAKNREKQLELMELQQRNDQLKVENNQIRSLIDLLQVNLSKLHMEKGELVKLAEKHKHVLTNFNQFLNIFPTDSDTFADFVPQNLHNHNDKHNKHAGGNDKCIITIGNNGNIIVNNQDKTSDNVIRIYI